MVAVDEVTAAERALHDRRALALRAAIEAGLPGRYEAFEADGLLVTLASPPELPFLRIVQGVTSASLDRLDEVLARCGDEAMPAVTVLADRVAALADALMSRGFAPAGEAPLLVARLPAPGAGVGRHDRDTDAVTIVETGDDPASVERFVEVLAAGYASSGHGGDASPASDGALAFLQHEHRRLVLRRYLATTDARPVAAAATSLHSSPDGAIAVLGGASTVPEARRTGVQAALLRRRLVDAARDGCWLAASTAAPDSVSLRNLERAGMTHVRRQLWVQPAFASDPDTAG